MRVSRSSTSTSLFPRLLLLSKRRFFSFGANSCLSTPCVCSYASAIIRLHVAHFMNGKSSLSGAGFAFLYMSISFLWPGS